MQKETTSAETELQNSKGADCVRSANNNAKPMLAAAFCQPMEVNNTTDVRTLLPKKNEIPDGFDTHWNKWNKAVTTWFFDGIRKDAFSVKEGIDKDKAFKHLSAVISSWDLKHEHKTAGAAYLMSLWFSDVSLK